MNDILIAGDELEVINEIEQWLKLRFKMKDMGEVEHVISNKITCDRLNKLLTLSQKSYLGIVLKRFNMITCMTN